MSVSVDDVVRALEDVHDPHIPVSLRGMGMLADVTVAEDGRVDVHLRLPCMACPGTTLLEERVAQRVSSIEGVTSCAVELGWHLPWDREDVEPEARQLMRTHGIQI